MENAAEKAKQLKERTEREWQQALEDRRRREREEQERRRREREEQQRQRQPSRSFWSALLDVLDFECNCPDCP